MQLITMYRLVQDRFSSLFAVNSDLFSRKAQVSAQQQPQVKAAGETQLAGGKGRCVIMVPIECVPQGIGKVRQVQKPQVNLSGHGRLEVRQWYGAYLKILHVRQNGFAVSLEDHPASLSHAPAGLNPPLEGRRFSLYLYLPKALPANPMKFKHVVIQSLAAVEPPIRVTSREIEDKLKPTLDRLGVRDDLLEEVSGIGVRRFWEKGTSPSDAATLAAEKALDEAGIDRQKIGVVINTSVCRDYLEPSTACIVHGNLRLNENCLNFDVGNACLAFMNGMDIAARMIERAEIEYALIVDGESSRPITEATIERMLDPEVTADQFRAEFASLTLGSGAAAMVLARKELAPEGHPYLGSVSRAATEFNDLCRGQMDQMKTDTRILLSEGLKLAAKTFHAAKIALGWVASEMDQFVIHQVSKVHTDSLVNLLGLDPEKVHAIYPEMGNIGPASVPIVLAKAVELGRVRKGDRVALLGIGSGLNCAMAEVVW